jgi:glutamine amidotransferase
LYYDEREILKYRWINKMPVVIVDYGVGNLESIRNMLKKAGFESKVSSRKEDILQADRLILPGVGAFDACALKLRQSELINVLEEKVFGDKVPILGICVGLQLLMRASEEGRERGLGWIEGDVIRFDAARLPGSVKIPHMGWTEVIEAKPSLLLDEIIDPRFYFVHSYHVLPDDDEDILLTANYGYPFAAAVLKNNIMGVQFHPEKSHKYGMKLLSNFATKLR